MTDLDAAIRRELDQFCESDMCAEKGKAAILAVLDMHVPEETGFVDRDGQERVSTDCEVCGDGGVPDSWPCPTLLAIAKGLGIEPA